MLMKRSPSRYIAPPQSSAKLFSKVQFSMYKSLHEYIAPPIYSVSDELPSTMQFLNVQLIMVMVFPVYIAPPTVQYFPFMKLMFFSVMCSFSLWNILPLLVPSMVWP